MEEELVLSLQAGVMYAKEHLHVQITMKWQFTMRRGATELILSRGKFVCMGSQ